MKKTLAIATAAIILLSGCSATPTDVARYNNYKLCQHLDSDLVLAEIGNRKTYGVFIPQDECDIIWNRAVNHSFMNTITNYAAAATPHADVNISQSQ